MIAAASTSLTQRAQSLRQFARFGAVTFGIIAGITSAATATSNRESALKAAIAKRDAQIAELTSENQSLKAPEEGEGKSSSGDPIQDWVDGLGK